MNLRLGFGLLWLGFVLYAIVLAPPDDPEATFELIRRLVTGDLQGINPLIIAEFNLMGVLPLIYWCLLFIDGNRQKQLGLSIPAWPLATLMMAVGAFALLPYLGLRRPLTGAETFKSQLPWTLALWNSAWTGRLLMLGSLGLLGFGIGQGDWLDFWTQWQTSRFIHVMTLDFLLLVALLPYLVSQDQIGREPGVCPQGLINGLPLLGPLAYLATRPTLQSPTEL